jgi:thymidylate synthase (FAD)
MSHCVVASAEEILDREFPVLDHGFIRLVDYLGGDERIVQAARVSYAEGTKSWREDAALIDYLLRNEHTSPFEQVMLTFHIKLPVFVARQWVRHRTARINEISGRYSIMKDEFYKPAQKDLAKQSDDNKQGRAEVPLSAQEAEAVLLRFEAGQKAAYADYAALIEGGLAREIARINLPLSIYTEWYWQIDLHNLFRFLALRIDPHAQLEIRAYAEVLLDITKRVAPAATQSFETHIKGGTRFSETEMTELRRRLGTASGPDRSLSHRELERFEAKLKTGKQR